MANKTIPLSDDSDNSSGFDHNLSSQIDQARQKEEHYRNLLLFWKKRRQRLEAKIPNNPFKEFIDELEL